MPRNDGLLNKWMNQLRRAEAIGDRLGAMLLRARIEKALAS